MKTIIKWTIRIAIAVIIVKAFVNFVNPEVTDVTSLAALEKTEIERQLGFTLTNDVDMVRKIYAYTNGEVTVDSNKENGIAVVYIDGEQAGLHIDNREYGMYGISIGDSYADAEETITYQYDDSYKVLNDMFQGSSTATFYRNSAKGDCFVVVLNDLTSRVVALTYFSEGNKATEQLH